MRERRSPLVRFLGYVRPHRWLIAGASLAGILKFVIPLLLPLILKYIADVLVAAVPHPSKSDPYVAAWCEALLHWIPALGTGTRGHLAALGLTILGTSLLLLVVSFYRSYWAGRPGTG